jgi:hypothetical protein
LILRVFVSDIIVKKDKYGPPDYYWIVGRLPSGIEVIIEDIYHDLRECIGHHVEMLLSFIRSPYCELERGIHNQSFLPEKYYSVELIDELLSKEGVISTGNERTVILSGEYIDSYTIPERWVPLTQRKPFIFLFKEPSALKTEGGTYLLYPWHSTRRVSIEEMPKEVIMAGALRLEAWTPSQ